MYSRAATVVTMLSFPQILHLSLFIQYVTLASDDARDNLVNSDHGDIIDSWPVTHARLISFQNMEKSCALTTNKKYPLK